MTTAPQVWNLRHKNRPKDAIYCGRGTPWGNPYVAGRHGSRDTVCDRFEQFVLPDLDVTALRGRHLLCWCKPLRCHCDAILKKANMDDYDIIRIGDHALAHGDCLTVMQDMDDASVDMILCDPPYGTINWKCPEKWDNVIPFEDMWAAYWRVLKPKGVIALFGNEPFSTLLKASQLRRYKYDYVWVKSRPGGFANAKVKPLKRYELISIFSEGTTSPGRPNNMPYFPQGLIASGKTVKNSGSSRIGFTVREGNPSQYVQEFTNYPGDILHYDNESGFHPTQKPVDLLAHLICTYTEAGGLVLDNTMGSGSTGVACQRTGRRFRGIEQDRKFFEIAAQRVSASDSLSNML